MNEGGKYEREEGKKQRRGVEIEKTKRKDYINILDRRRERINVGGRKGGRAGGKGGGGG